MNMIMPAEFERRTKEILDGDSTNELKVFEYQVLMTEVLNSLGYGAGIKAFNDYMLEA